jgi:hypothetical protein
MSSHSLLRCGFALGSDSSDCPFRSREMLRIWRRMPCCRPLFDRLNHHLQKRKIQFYRTIPPPISDEGKKDVQYLLTRRQYFCARIRGIQRFRSNLFKGLQVRATPISHRGMVKCSTDERAERYKFRFRSDFGSRGARSLGIALPL